MTRKWIYLIVPVVAVLHHDFWFWNDKTLLFGFLPVGLAYHGFYSILASAMWALILFKAWPDDVEQFANTPPEEGDKSY